MVHSSVASSASTSTQYQEPLYSPDIVKLLQCVSTFLFLPLQEKCAKYLAPEHQALIARAFLVAVDAHETQFRSSGEPYITHPVAVSCILADMQMDHESIIAALLHDVVEDTDMTQADLADLFGDKVAELVEGVTKLTQITFKTKAEAQAENFRKMMLAMVEDIRVILIKMADRLHNMRTLGALKPEKRRRIARETVEIYAPIANRLGMNTFRMAFQDLGFEAMYPMRFRVLEQSVRTAVGNRRQLMDRILCKLQQRLEEENIPPEHISGREKRLYSIFRKMRNKGLPFSEIMDVYGFRVVTSTINDCYRVLGAVHSLFRPVPGRFKDYIAIPKANGYQSLHTTLFGPYGVPIEIQIRTTEMNNTAENGIAAHWLYKSEGYASTTEVRTREWLQRLLDMQLRASSSLELIEDVKLDLFPDEVYVFTPDGDIMELPRGATPIDFAYAVHTQIGNSCVAARVNRRAVPLSQTLVNGQTVEIVRAEHTHPNPNWLNFVVTGKARSAIKHYLKDQRTKEAINLGERLLRYSLSEFALDWKQVSKKHKEAILQAFQYKKLNELLQSIGQGERASAVAAHQIQELVLTNPEGETDISENAIPITGREGVNMRFSSCCQPIPGDAVIGILARGRGIEVHRTICPVVKNYANSEAFVPLRWAEEGTERFPVDVYLEIYNERGVLAKVANIIAEAQSDIQLVNVSERDRVYGIIALSILVKDRVHLATIIRRLKKVKEVMRVQRVKKTKEEA